MHHYNEMLCRNKWRPAEILLINQSINQTHLYSANAPYVASESQAHVGQSVYIRCTQSLSVKQFSFQSMTETTERLS